MKKRNSFQKSVLTKALLLTCITGLNTACKKQIAVSTAGCIMPEEAQERAAQANAEDPKAEVDPPKVCTLPLKSEDANITQNIVLQEFDAEHEVKMHAGIERLMLAINSVEFKEKVLAHEYKGKKGFAGITKLTNEQVYQMILDGAETLQPEVDSEIDLPVIFYYANNGTVGYTYPSKQQIWVNKKFFVKNTLGKVAGNLAHEWCHKLGFKHDKSRTARRKYSVPYAVGYIVKDIVDNM